MDRKEIERQIKEALADRLDIALNKIDLSSRLIDDLGMDSFKAVEIAFEAKERLGVNISNDEMAKIITVDDIINILAIKKC